MLKVMTIIGTRPELIKMSRVMAEFDQHIQESASYRFGLCGLRAPCDFAEINLHLNNNTSPNEIFSRVERNQKFLRLVKRRAH